MLDWEERSRCTWCNRQRRDFGKGVTLVQITSQAQAGSKDAKGRAESANSTEVRSVLSPPTQILSASFVCPPFVRARLQTSVVSCSEANVTAHSDSPYAPVTNGEVEQYPYPDMSRHSVALQVLAAPKAKSPAWVCETRHVCDSVHHKWLAKVRPSGAACNFKSSSGFACTGQILDAALRGPSSTMTKSSDGSQHVQDCSQCSACLGTRQLCSTCFCTCSLRPWILGPHCPIWTGWMNYLVFLLARLPISC